MLAPGTTTPAVWILLPYFYVALQLILSHVSSTPCFTHLHCRVTYKSHLIESTSLGCGSWAVNPAETQMVTERMCKLCIDSSWGRDWIQLCWHHHNIWPLLKCWANEQGSQHYLDVEMSRPWEIGPWSKAINNQGFTPKSLCAIIQINQELHMQITLCICSGSSTKLCISHGAI